jgi:hypothetical protein
MIHQSTSKFLLLLLSLMLVVSGCQGQPSANRMQSASDADTPGKVQEVTFTAADLCFSGPDRVAAGSTHIHLVNEGNDVHHIQIIKLSNDILSLLPLSQVCDMA